MFYNLLNGQRSKPFEKLADAQTAAHDFVMSAFDNGFRPVVETIDETDRIITEFRMYEI